jgi:hypothetical protein
MKWIKASENISFEGQSICRWFENGEFERIELMSAHYLKDWSIKNRIELEDIEWLDETAE